MSFRKILERVFYASFGILKIAFIKTSLEARPIEIFNNFRRTIAIYINKFSQFFSTIKIKNLICDISFN